MRVVIQRVCEATVMINSERYSSIGHGLVVLLGIETADSSADVEWLVNKTLGLRIFNDVDRIMNRSILDVEGELMIISQFTLMAATKKGNRPSYIRAAKHEHAVPLYKLFVEKAASVMEKPVATGIFGADMQVALVNDGPMTICIDSKNRE